MAAERSAARDRPVRRPLARALAVFFVVVALAAALATAWAGAASASRIGRVHHVPRERPLVVRGDSAAVARGRQLATAIANCAACHGEDLGGAVYGDMGPVGMVAGPNLTRGRGGRGGALTDADWDRAVRHGVRRDGTSLIMMPSEAFYVMSDDDLAAIVAFARVGGPPGTPHSSNITRAGIPAWTEADFVRAMRTGRRPDGSVVNEFMPWRQLGRMTDDELHALWLYLRSAPPRATGNK